MLEVRDNTELDSISLDEKIKTLENELELIYLEKARGAQVRAREKWVEQGEKNTSFFLGLEKKRQVKKAITKLKSSTGEIISDQAEILTLEKQYYKNLFTSNNANSIESKLYIQNTDLENKLNDTDSDVCEGKITLEECELAVARMKSNKSPGLDGITTEFYQKFWPDLKNILVNVYNNSFDCGILPFSQRQSVLSLIFKKGDPLQLSNYRPISLLNNDLKILSHCLAQRLKKVLYKIINSDQNGFIKNRYIGFNLRQIQDVIDYCNQYSIEGAIVFIDFSKAFDSLEWDFMNHTLDHFGFKQNFINWVKTMYNDIYCSVTNNGWLSERFKCTKGIRQGCPLSALLFVLSVEIMAIRLRKDKNIKGIQVKIDMKTHSLKISQLADDTTLFLGEQTGNNKCTKFDRNIWKFLRIKIK